MKEPDSISHRNRAIAIWLWLVAALILAMVLVGGATRLTESGLSIVEWKPVTGTLPPLSEPEWAAEFEKYKAIPQYQQVNRGMSLDEFKTIFWWEWTHRLLGRIIGAAFLLPFLWFLWRGWVGPGLRGRLWTIFALGGFQGAVGWWMVASGLADRVNVSQYRLAFHLTVACVIFVAVLWTAERLSIRRAVYVPRRLRWSAGALVVCILLQIYLGALVAGLRAGLIYNTWPLIDGGFIPPLSGLMFQHPAWRNLFENALTVQFDHRMVAYGLWMAVMIHLVDVWRSTQLGCVRGFALALAGFVSFQAALGIATLLHQVPIPLALAHQCVAMLALGTATLHAARMTVRQLVPVPA